MLQAGRASKKSFFFGQHLSRAYSILTPGHENLDMTMRFFWGVDQD